MDEFGSRIQHSDTPNVRLVPFCYVPTQAAFTIMWPLSNIEEGGVMCCVFLLPTVMVTSTKKLHRELGSGSVAAN